MRLKIHSNRTEPCLGVGVMFSHQFKYFEFEVGILTRVYMVQIRWGNPF